jgi:hypothetical protein
MELFCEKWHFFTLTDSLFACKTQTSTYFFTYNDVFNQILFMLDAAIKERNAQSVKRSVLD